MRTTSNFLCVSVLFYKAFENHHWCIRQSIEPIFFSLYIIFGANEAASFLVNRLYQILCLSYLCELQIDFCNKLEDIFSASFVQFFLKVASHSSKIYNTKYTKYCILERYFFQEIARIFVKQLQAELAAAKVEIIRLKQQNASPLELFAHAPNTTAPKKLASTLRRPRRSRQDMRHTWPFYLSYSLCPRSP